MDNLFILALWISDLTTWILKSSKFQSLRCSGLYYVPRNPHEFKGGAFGPWLGYGYALTISVRSQVLERRGTSLRTWPGRVESSSTLLSSLCASWVSLVEQPYPVHPLPLGWPTSETSQQWPETLCTVKQSKPFLS